MTPRQPVVVGLDFSEGSKAALVRAADLAERFHAGLHLVHVSSTVYSDYGGVHPDAMGNSFEHRIRDFAVAALGGTKAFDVIGPEIVVRRGEAAPDALVRYADAVSAGLVVVGTHGRRGVRHMLMGSVAEEVVRRAPCPVLTVPNTAARTAPSPTSPVLVPVDLAEANRDALVAARLFAEQFAAPVEVVHVVEDDGLGQEVLYHISGLLTINDTVPAAVEKIEARLRRFVDEAGGGVARTHVRSGRPDREITSLADETGAGLIVMATHGLAGLERVTVGSVTERTLRGAPCPVLSLRAVTAADEAFGPYSL